ncbi:hypothetical protein ATANTOWER_002967 [Ataeniobius toweri]|uniref:Uncharacterized protein n=1 Tax=Ataeniobius toweri TaxID=208326 RepID=A0ABU7C5X3_9TELE|nr:hypothetical protein [Ataeniobius toweri]
MGFLHRGREEKQSQAIGSVISSEYCCEEQTGCDWQAPQLQLVELIRRCLRGAGIPERDGRLFAHIAWILFPQSVLGFYLGGWCSSVSRTSKKILPWTAASSLLTAPPSS